MEVEWGRQEVRDDRGLISPPWVELAWQCATVIVVRGYVPNARLDIEIDGAIAVGDFPGELPNPSGAIVALPAALVAGQTIRALQKTDSTQSDWSVPVVAADHKAVFPQGLPIPEINPAPLYRCGRRTGVRNLLVGCDVWIISDSKKVGQVFDAAAHQGVDVVPPYEEGQSVFAQASLCGDRSPPSAAQTVQPPPSPLPIPAPDPIYPGSQQVIVNNIANGAQLDVSRNGVFEFATLAFGVSSLLTFDKPFETGEKVSVVQQLCADAPPSSPGSVSVSPCPALPAPEVWPVKTGDTSVTLTAFVPDATIKVFVNGTKKGEGSGPVLQLVGPVPSGATILVHQATATCVSTKAQQLTARCFAPQIAADPSASASYSVGFRSYDGGTTQVTSGASHRIAGTIYYPSQLGEGENAQFLQDNFRSLSFPIVFLVHGNAAATLPSHLGYDYLQRQLAALGMVAVSVDCTGTNGPGGGATNIRDRADLIVASIRYWQGTGILWGPVSPVNFRSIGLMGHSRGGEAVLLVDEIYAQFNPDVGVGAVLSLAPTNAKASNGVPKGYAYMTIVPAADGDVVTNDGVEFYDAAWPGPFKSQLYVHNANHNYFNRQWPRNDAYSAKVDMGLPIMARPDHERILSAYGCAFFRAALLGHDMKAYLDGSVTPEGVQADKVHLSFQLSGQVTVDDHEQPGGIDSNSMGRPTAQMDGLSAQEHPFGPLPDMFNASFYGNTVGMVSQSEREGRFRSELDQPRDLSRSEVWIRAAEVYEFAPLEEGPTGFALGLEDTSGQVLWLDCEGIGGLPRPFYRRDFDLAVRGDDFTKTILKTLRFPPGCFEAQGRESGFDIRRVTAIWLRQDRRDGRPLAFDDLQIVTR